MLFALVRSSYSALSLPSTSTNSKAEHSQLKANTNRRQFSPNHSILTVNELGEDSSSWHPTTLRSFVVRGESLNLQTLNLDPSSTERTFPTKST